MARPSSPASFSSRAARLTAGPMQVKSSRLLAADIAVEHLAEMQRQAEADAARRRLRPSIAATRAARLVRRGEGGGAAARRRIAGRDRKDRQQPVAHEFQHFAAVLEDRRDLRSRNSG